MAKSSLALLALALSSNAYAAPAAQQTRPVHFAVSGACGEQERWQLGGNVPKAWFDVFVRAISKKGSLLADYNKSFIMKQRLKSKEAQALADYWANRTLYRMGLIHLAHRNFNQMVAQMEGPETFGIRMGALECLNLINRSYAHFSLSQEAITKLAKKPWGSQSLAKAQVHQVYEAAFHFLKNQPEKTSLTSGVSGQAFELIKDAGPYEALIQAFNQLNIGDYQEAAGAVKRYFSYPRTIEEPYEALKKFDDMAHLLLARAYYEFKQYDRAIEEFKKISVESNFFPRSLSDISWAYLRKKAYNDAVGAAFSLQTGGMARTFNPEAPVVAAISLVELCHYPEALRQLRYLQKSYYKPYKWLREWKSRPVDPNRTLYHVATEYMKAKSSDDKKNAPKTDVPSKVATEWFRSPVFIASQKEVNLIYDEKDMMRRIATRLKKIRRPAFENLKGQMAGIWNELVTLEKSLLARISADLTETNTRMISEIASAAENAQLVEAEVYNAAGEDMIRTNARPDLIVAARKVKNDPKTEKLPTWDWGRLPAADADENVEVWEDELGFLRGDLTDLCPKAVAPKEAPKSPANAPAPTQGK